MAAVSPLPRLAARRVVHARPTPLSVVLERTSTHSLQSLQCGLCGSAPALGLTVPEVAAGVYVIITSAVSVRLFVVPAGFVGRCDEWHERPSWHSPTSAVTKHYKTPPKHKGRVGIPR